MTRQELSRRQMLAFFGGLGMGGVMAACGGLGVLAWWLTRTPSLIPSEGEPLPTAQVAQVTPPPSATPPPQPPIPLITREAWGAQPINHEATYENGFYSADNNEGWRVYEDVYSAYQTLVVHHSVIESATDLLSVREVQRLHLVDRGWADVGYHFLIGKDGTLYEGRTLSARGTHVAGYNTGSVGVCLLGNLSQNTPPDAQWQALIQVTVWLKALLGVTHLAAHRDFNELTECPGNTLWFALDGLAEGTGLIRGTGGYVAST